MTLYLVYSKIIKETEKARIILFDLSNTNQLKKDLIFETESGNTLSISEIPKNFKFSLCIPMSVSDIYPEIKAITIPAWFYSKNLHNTTFKINKSDFVQFGKICPLWLRKTAPERRFPFTDEIVPLFSETYSEIDLRDNSHLY